MLELFMHEKPPDPWNAIFYYTEYLEDAGFSFINATSI